MRTILILGCGWVGEELATKMLQKGYTVYASTTSLDKAERLQQQGVHSFVHNFDQSAVCQQALPEWFDFVLTSVPAGSRLPLTDVHKRFTHVHAFLEKLLFTKNIFLSSTGVYPNSDGVYTEAYSGALNERLYAAETKMLSLAHTSVFRLGGLFGKNRILAKYFENRVCTSGDQLANFVHLDDVVELIRLGLENTIQEPIYNIVAPEHPTKKEVIIASAKRYGYSLPIAWQPEDSFQKCVDSAKIRNELQYTFTYPNPIDF